MKYRHKNIDIRQGGFTVAELVLAFSVMSVVLAAAATLAFAMSSAEASTNEMGEKQAHLRFASMRIGEVVRNSCMAFTYSDTGILFWVEDENSDGIMNGQEMAWLVTDSKKTTVQLIEFYDQPMVVTRDGLQNGSDLLYLYYTTEDVRQGVLLSGCQEVNITLDADEEFVTIDLNIEENDIWKEYQICGGLRAKADYMYDHDGKFVTGDDDL